MALRGGIRYGDFRPLATVAGEALRLMLCILEGVGGPRKNGWSMYVSTLYETCSYRLTGY